MPNPFLFMAASGLLNMAAGQEQASAAEAQNKVKHLIAMSNYNMKVMQGGLENTFMNLQISRSNQARMRQNRAISKAANETRFVKERDLAKTFGGQLVKLGRGYTQALDSLATSSIGAGLNAQSGTVKALRRQILASNGQQMQNLREDNFISRQNIIREQENALAQRDLYGWNAESYFMPGQPPQYLEGPGYSPLQGAADAISGAGMAADFMGNTDTWIDWSV